MFKHGFPPEWSTIKKLIWLRGTGAIGEVLKTITGSIVSFIAKKVTPIEELKVAIEPVQSGSGDPSPTNVRPITGWTGCNIYQSGADTSNPTIYPISWQTEAGTVYGGTLDVTTGVLTVDRVSIDMGTLTWNNVSDSRYFRARYTNLPFAPKRYNGGQTKALCSCFKRHNGSAASLPDKAFVIGNIDISSTYAVLARNYDITTTADFTTSVTGQTLVYEVETPTEYQLTPEQLSTLKGENNIWADTGDVTVTAAGIKEITPSSAQALNMLLGGMYTNNHTADDVSDDEALDIILGGSNA